MKNISFWISLALIVVIQQANGSCDDTCWCKCFNAPSSGYQPYYSQFKYLVEKAISRRKAMGAGGTTFYYDYSFSSGSLANLLQPIQNNIAAMLALTLPVSYNFNPYQIIFNTGYPWGSLAFMSNSWNCRDKCDASSRFQSINYRNYNNYNNRIHDWFIQYGYNNLNFNRCMRNKNIFKQNRLLIMIGNSNVNPVPVPSPKGIAIGVGASSITWSTFAIQDPFLYFKYSGSYMSNHVSRISSERIVKCMRESCCRHRGKRSIPSEKETFVGVSSRSGNKVLKEETTFNQFIKDLEHNKQDHIKDELEMVKDPQKF